MILTKKIVFLIVLTNQTFSSLLNRQDTFLVISKEDLNFSEFSEIDLPKKNLEEKKSIKENNLESFTEEKNMKDLKKNQIDILPENSNKEKKLFLENNNQKIFEENFKIDDRKKERDLKTNVVNESVVGNFLNLEKGEKSENLQNENVVSNLKNDKKLIDIDSELENKKNLEVENKILKIDSNEKNLELENKKILNKDLEEKNLELDNKILKIDLDEKIIEKEKMENNMDFKNPEILLENKEKCNITFKSIFVKNKLDFYSDIAQSIESNELYSKIHEFCPNNTTTCCSVLEIESLVQTQKLYIKEENKNLKKMYEFFKILKNHKKKKIGHIKKKCQKKEKLDYYITKILENEKEIILKYEKYTKKIFQSSLNMICQICSSENKYFNLDKEKNIYNLEIEEIEMKNFFENYLMFLDFGELFDILEILECNYNDEYKNFEYNEIINDIKNNLDFENQTIEIENINPKSISEEILKSSKIINIEKITEIQMSKILENEKIQKIIKLEYSPNGFKKILFNRAILLLNFTLKISPRKNFKKIHYKAINIPLDQVDEILYKDFIPENIFLKFEKSGFNSNKFLFSETKINEIFGKFDDFMVLQEEFNGGSKGDFLDMLLGGFYEYMNGSFFKIFGVFLFFL